MVARLASGVTYAIGLFLRSLIPSHHLWVKFVLGVYIFNLVLALNSSVLSVQGPDKSSQTQTGVAQEM